MRSKVERYVEKNRFCPEIGIVFCGNRAVVTIREKEAKGSYVESARNHINVYYGLFFWVRLSVACFRCWIKIK